jgi:hypothetical protein
VTLSRKKKSASPTPKKRGRPKKIRWFVHK